MDYNADQGEKYTMKSDYGSKPVGNSNSYGTQNQNSLPMYQTSSSENPMPKRKSKCPRGAILGEIGTCCGMNCTRACALEG